MSLLTLLRCMGIGGIPPRILNLNTGWRWMLSVDTLPPQEEYAVSVEKVFLGSRSVLVLWRREENILPLLGIESRLLGYWTPSPVIVPTTKQKSYKKIKACNMPVGLLRSEEGFLAVSYIGFKFYGIKLVYITWHFV